MPTTNVGSGRAPTNLQTYKPSPGYKPRIEEMVRGEPNSDELKQGLVQFSTSPPPQCHWPEPGCGAAQSCSGFQTHFTPNQPVTPCPRKVAHFISCPPDVRARPVFLSRMTGGWRMHGRCGHDLVQRLEERVFLPQITLRRLRDVLRKMTRSIGKTTNPKFNCFRDI